MKGIKTIASSLILVLMVVSSTFAFSQKLPKDLAPGIYAAISTAKGQILVQLEVEKAPMTVANFVGLAEGKFKPLDKVIAKPLYKKMKFHRVIADFMIQGGDPKGTGEGDAGYSFYDEFDPTLKHNGPGILSMANSGPNTNSSQFFITHKETPWLDGLHSVFGHVIEGQEVVNAIQQDDAMKSIKIIRVGDQYKNWNATEVFNRVYNEKKAAEEARIAEEARRKAEFEKIMNGLKPGIYALFETTKGNIIVELEYQKAPMTVANFVGLAEGRFTAMNHTYNKPFYDGLKFHRVIADFMIQGGDPMGNGMGGPDHKFADEINPTLKHIGPGILSMANSGPNTNGSQFFITHKATPWLDGKHTVFGHVIAGQDVVNAIEQNDLMKKVSILRIGEAQKAWDATAEFAKVMDQKLKEEQALKAEEEKLRKIDEERIAKISALSEAEYKVVLFKEIKAKYPNAKQTASGLIYIIEKQGTGLKARTGDQVSTHYNGTLLSGKKFDSSYDRNQPLNFKHNVGQMIKGYDEGVSLLNEGGKGKFIIPYFNAYGKAGRGPVIGPYSDLMFDIELIQVTPSDLKNPVAPEKILEKRQ